MDVNIEITLKSTLAKASFMLDGEYVEKNDLILRYTNAIIGLLTKSPKDRGIILHQGTCVPLYFAIVLACFNCYLSDDSDKTAFLEDLEIGDLVLYQNKRGTFLGRDSNANIIIENIDKGKTRTTNLIPESVANKIQPYFGDGKSLDGRGIKRKRNITGILSELFGIKNQDIRSVMSKSVLVVCDKFIADDVFGKMSIGINSLTFKMSEVFPAAYITSNEVYSYSGNVAKAEPVIQFVNKLSLARELIIENKKIETVIIANTEYFTNDLSELISIYDRKTLKSIIMLGEVSKVATSSQILSQFENLQPYVWTKRFLVGSGKESHTFNSHSVKLHDESKRIRRMISNFVDNEIETSIIKDPLSIHSLFEEKKRLLHLCRETSERDIKENILRKCFWLINLIEGSYFPIFVMEDLISIGVINAPSPRQELDSIKMSLTSYIGTSYFNVISNIIEKITDRLYSIQLVNPKFDYLLEVIKKRVLVKRKISIISAKQYYQKIFSEAVPLHFRSYIDKVDFYTTNSFDTTMMYHNVYVVGAWNWSQLNPLLLSNTKKVSFVLYRSELNRFTHASEKTEHALQLINEKNLLTDKEIYTSTTLIARETNNSNSEYDEDFVEDQIESLTEKLLPLSFSFDNDTSPSNSGGQVSEVVRVAILETGEKMYFTKSYSAYTYDPVRQIVQEVDVITLREGELLILTTNDSGTRDIVEKIMDIILESNDCSIQFKHSYQKSLVWKRILKEFMKKNQVTYRELSEKLSQYGTLRHEATLRAWLDETRYIIGPRDIDSYKSIAKVTNDPDMLANPESYQHSNKEVRSMRVRILKFLGKNIIRSYNKSIDDHDELLSKLSTDVSKMSRLVQIEKIITVSNVKVLSHYVNKPIIF